ncbi:MAG: hypothetical protein HIU91_15120 [Acidobacteria bacterium]|nr:hypothetical protein [Acidobacteriota bacterium]
MKPLVCTLRYALLVALAAGFAAAPTPRALAQSATPSAQHSAAPGILDRTQSATIMPSSVFYAGQSAPTQGRNSAGIRFPGGRIAIMAMVDTSGYSSAVAQRYQAYLLTELPLIFGSQTLAPGAYGFGFVAGNRVLVMNIAGDEVAHTSSTRDDQLHRPTPLQILPDPSNPNAYRLYLGRDYITLAASGTPPKANK